MAETILNKEAAKLPNDPIKNNVRNLTKERDDECIPVAREILRLIGNHADLPVGSTESGITQDSAIEYYGNIYVNEIGPLLIEKNVKIDDVKYIFSLVLQAVNFLKDRTEMTLENHYNNATAYKWGVHDTDEIRLNMIHEALMNAPGQSVDNKVEQEKAE